MANKFQLTKESCEDIGFVKKNLFIGVITKSEFREWILFVIKMSAIDELPIYIYELIDFNGYLDELLEIIGFVPYSNLNEEEENALYGIAIKRFNNVYDMPISKEKGLKALKENKHILERFKKTFPFIELNF